MNDKSKRVQQGSRPEEAVQIRYDNALTYPTPKDAPYFVSDTTKHLKLRILTTCIVGKPEGRTWYYDYYWNGKRCRAKLGTIGTESKTADSLTPKKARELVNSYESNRLQGKHPLKEYEDDVSSMSLNIYYKSFMNRAEIKPSVSKRGVVMGNTEWEYNQKALRYKRNLETNVIGKTPIVDLTVKEIREWFDEMVMSTPTEAVKSLNLAKHMTRCFIEDNEADVPNRFTKIDTKPVKKSIDENQEKRPMTPEEYKALWFACDEWHNKVEGLFIQFIMQTSARGKAIADVKRDDVKKVKGQYQFNTLHKGKRFLIVLNDTAEDIYLKALKEAKKYPISPYLFPNYIYSRNGKGTQSTSRRQQVIDVRAEPMDNNSMKRIFKGRSTKKVKGKLVKHTNGGIRGIASIAEPSILTVNLHDIRDTWASMSSNLEEATDLLQNTNSATVSKHYRHKGAEHYTKLSVVRENLHKKLLDE
jgi:integrase